MTCKIQLKHPHGPISIIVEYLPKVEQIKLQGVNTAFYGKVIPGLVRKIKKLRTFNFAALTVNPYRIIYQYVSERGQMKQI